MTVSIADAIAQRRLLLSWLLFVPLLTYLVFSAPSWDAHSYTALAAESVGFILLMAAVFGRVWCLTYIGGYKNGELITAGPYSLVRNPLYVFSFLGAIGFGLNTENLVATFIVFVVFVVYYPLVVVREERRLEERYGQAFRDYKQRTPCWFPRFSNFSEPETYVVKPAFVRRGILGSMWFLWFSLFHEVVEKLQELGAIPILW